MKLRVRVKLKNGKDRSENDDEVGFLLIDDCVESEMTKVHGFRGLQLFQESQESQEFKDS